MRWGITSREFEQFKQHDKHDIELHYYTAGDTGAEPAVEIECMTCHVVVLVVHAFE